MKTWVTRIMQPLLANSSTAGTEIVLGIYVQLTPNLMVFKGPTILIGEFLLLPIKRIKINFSRDLRIASIMGGFPLLAGLV